MKKLLSLLVAILVVFTLSACGKETFEIAMITDSGTIDDQSFNQGTWEGIEQFGDENEISYNYYKPQDISDTAYLRSIDLAVKGGAKVVITPGFFFINSVSEAQNKYPDVKFIILDAIPTEIKDNTLAYIFNEHESGFLAGYAAVKDGYTKLGFTGGSAVPAVIKFGVGFIAGAHYAANEENVAIELSNDRYYYFNDFEANDNHKNKAASWYVDGTELIFSAAGGAGSSVMLAAEENGGKVVGVDTDQAGLSDTVVTSAMKQLAFSVIEALTAWQNDNFVGGRTIVKGADNNGIGLPMDTSRFNTFSQADYEAIYDKVAEGTIVVPQNHEELVSFFAEEGITATNYPTADVIQP